MSQKPSNKWIKRYLEIAQAVSTWSKDPSKKIGAVAIGQYGQILSQGYNGFPRGIHDSTQRLVDRSLKLKYTVHAEPNCIFNAGLNGVSLRDSTLYVFGLPVCTDCANAVIQSGIKRVYACIEEEEIPERWHESAWEAAEKFEEAGVEYTLYTWNEFLSLVPTPQMRPLRWTGAYELVPPSTDSISG